MGRGSGVAFAAASYAGYVAAAWYRYGQEMRRATGEARTSLLDRFMPVYEVAERHHVRVAAPAEITMAAAPRWIFRSRRSSGRFSKAASGSWAAVLRRATRNRVTFSQMRAIGWGELAVIPGRESSWAPSRSRGWPTSSFDALPPDEFAAFHEPGYVKIVWSLRADPSAPTNRSSAPKRGWRPPIRPRAPGFAGTGRLLRRASS